MSEVFTFLGRCQFDQEASVVGFQPSLMCSLLGSLVILQQSFPRRGIVELFVWRVGCASGLFARAVVVSSIGGLGMRSAVRISVAAWWASWGDSLEMTAQRHPSFSVSPHLFVFSKRGSS